MKFNVLIKNYSKKIVSKIKENEKIQKFSVLYDEIAVKYFHKGELKDNILIKYLIKDLFLYFFVAFLFFFMIFFVNQILLTVEDLLAASAPFGDVMKCMFYSFPGIIAQSTPFATLVGFLMCLGGMMSNNEILIFRASGFSFFSIAIPVLLLGLAISIGSFFVNDYLLPLGNMKYYQLMREIIYSTPTIELESNSVKTLNGTHLVIGDVNGNDVSDLIFIDNTGRKEKYIIAKNSTLIGSDKDGVLMELDMKDSILLTIDYLKPEDFSVMNSENTHLNIFDSTIMGSTSISPREMTTVDLYKDIQRLVNENDNSDYGKRRISLWKMEFHKKFSLPFGSIFFAFLAFSMAFLFGKHNGQTIGLFFGLIICVIYWAMQIVGQLFVQKIGLNPFWCIWVPNVVILFFGTVFYLRLIKK